MCANRQPQSSRLSGVDPAIAAFTESLLDPPGLARLRATSRTYALLEQRSKIAPKSSCSNALRTLQLRRNKTRIRKGSFIGLPEKTPPQTCKPSQKPKSVR